MSSATINFDAGPRELYSRYAASIIYATSKINVLAIIMGRPSLVDAYSACNISYTLRYMFAYA